MSLSRPRPMISADDADLIQGKTRLFQRATINAHGDGSLRLRDCHEMQ
jgi:hypothetical protein